MVSMSKLIGKKVGMLYIKKLIGRKRGNYLFLCVCDCGNQKVIGGNNLGKGTKSCGCLRVASMSERAKKHGFYSNPLYKTWRGMFRRCTDEKWKGYKNYGGRGIIVCERWSKIDNFILDMFDSWLDHVSRNGKKQTSLDRIDNDGNYTPGNCRWATKTEQVQNQRKRVSNR